MKIATYFLIFIAAIVTTVIDITSMTHPITPTAAGFIVWGLSPYACLALMVKLVSTHAAKLAVFIVTLLTGSLGVWLLVDALFIHIDAQGGLVFIFAPVFQWVLLVLASAPLYFLNRVKKV